MVGGRDENETITDSFIRDCPYCLPPAARQWADGLSRRPLPAPFSRHPPPCVQRASTTDAPKGKAKRKKARRDRGRRD